MRGTIYLAAAAILALTAAAPGPGEDDPDDDPQTIEVKMVDKGPAEFAFEPAEVTARPGDVIRFVQDGVQPHNVEFKNIPNDADLDGILMGPYLIRKGQTYEIRIDDRFVAGRYGYVCTPHEALGMRGAIIVQPAEDDHTQRSES